MNEFSLIEVFFKAEALCREEVIYGIGDDAACVSLPANQQLLISTDTLVADVHFLSSWDAYDIASRAVRVNVSDIAAMAAKPCWLSLALTLPEFDTLWLERFSKGLHDSLKLFNIALIGGDTTRGPLSITLTIHGLVPQGKSVRRSGAKPGDRIYVSGDIGAAALAVAYLKSDKLEEADQKLVFHKLVHPSPRVDLAEILQDFASAAIDISDGLSADLNHICVASGVGALLYSDAIPVHPVVKKYQKDRALEFALSGGDDYELCFTVPRQDEKKLLAFLAKVGLSCYPIGYIQENLGLGMEMSNGQIVELNPLGYRHF